MLSFCSPGTKFNQLTTPRLGLEMQFPILRYGRPLLHTPSILDLEPSRIEGYTLEANDNPGESLFQDLPRTLSKIMDPS